jgi:hypothetical protein
VAGEPSELLIDLRPERIERVLTALSSWLVGVRHVEILNRLRAQGSRLCRATPTVPTRNSCVARA